MIILFGPAGSGKSVQGHLLAARFDWRWLSAGQLLRDAHDPAFVEAMQKGEFVSDDQIRQVVGAALKNAKDLNGIILDGFPRQLQQAKWLVEAREELGNDIKLVVVLDVATEELERRLQIRGRADDTQQAIEHRLELYQEETLPILDYLNEHNVPLAHIDGNDTVGRVHDKIVEELVARGLVTQ